MNRWVDESTHPVPPPRKRGGKSVAPHRHAATPRPAGASEHAVEQAAALFRALGDPARLALLDRLAGGEYCVTELADATSDNLSTISERLKILRTEGLVARRREGKHVFYALADAHVAALVRNAIEHVTERGRV